MKPELAKMECKSCAGGPSLLKGDALQQMRDQLDGNWNVVDGQRLERRFKFPNFIEALQFADRVGEIAEQQQHHPDIYITYGEVLIQIWTHSVGGLTENDFILAAKIDQID